MRNAAKLCLLSALLLAGCRQLHQTDMAPLDSAGMSPDTVDDLRQLRVADAEVQQLVHARLAGLSDASCLELVRIARDRGQPFTDGESAGSLVDAGFHEDSILTLARLNELGLWSGEAVAMKLAGISDGVILDIARRRAGGQPVLSSPKVAALRNAGFSDSQLMAAIDNGLTDEQADRAIARRNDVGHTFVREARRR